MNAEAMFGVVPDVKFFRGAKETSDINAEDKTRRVLLNLLLALNVRDRTGPEISAALRYLFISSDGLRGNPYLKDDQIRIGRADQPGGVVLARLVVSKRG